VIEPTGTPPFEAPAAVAGLVRDGQLDAELAGLLSLTIAGGIPALVAGPDLEACRALRDALVSLVPPATSVVRLAGPDEQFGWMPQAGELGWTLKRGSAPVAPASPGAVMVADVVPGGTWGEAAHLAIRALTAGYSLSGAAGGAALDDVLGRLALPPVSAIDDELTRLGVVLVLDAGARVRIAHYLRPVARDSGGHVQRLPPAALAAFNASTGRYDHFAWGVAGELAGRTGWRPIAFEREQALRARAIAAAGSVT
jgi:hypothetical protein